MTTPRDSSAWNYRELETLLTLSGSLTEWGIEPLTIGSIRKNRTTKLSTNVNFDTRFGFKACLGVKYEVRMYFCMRKRWLQLGKNSTEKFRRMNSKVEIVRKSEDSDHLQTKILFCNRQMPKNICSIKSYSNT